MTMPVSVSAAFPVSICMTRPLQSAMLDGRHMTDQAKERCS
jgi:hypothetical protein